MKVTFLSTMSSRIIVIEKKSSKLKGYCEGLFQQLKDVEKPEIP